MGFLGIFTSGRYYKDIKTLKILASNSEQIDDDRGVGEVAKYNNFLDNFSLKQPLVLRILLGMFFDSRNSKMTSKLP